MAVFRFFVCDIAYAWLVGQVTNKGFVAEAVTSRDGNN